MNHPAHGVGAAAGRHCGPMSPFHHIDRSSPHFRKRIPVPPAGARFDAVFVHAVADLSRQLSEQRGAPTRPVVSGTSGVTPPR